jgi:hypothetical protein
MPKPPLWGEPRVGEPLLVGRLDGVAVAAPKPLDGRAGLSDGGEVDVQRVVVQLGPVERRVELQRLEHLAAVRLHRQPNLREGGLGLAVAQRHVLEERRPVGGAVEPERTDAGDEQQHQPERGDDDRLDADVRKHVSSSCRFVPAVSASERAAL